MASSTNIFSVCFMLSWFTSSSEMTSPAHIQYIIIFFKFKSNLQHIIYSVLQEVTSIFGTNKWPAIKNHKLSSELHENRCLDLIEKFSLAFTSGRKTLSCVNIWPKNSLWCSDMIVLFESKRNGENGVWWLSVDCLWFVFGLVGAISSLIVV